MTNDGISVPYNHELKPLEELLAAVRRPGDFFARGAVEVPMPRVEVDGVGVLSFPVPEPQIGQLIQQAVRAPYGRGEETILDESVRKVWQLPPDKVSLGGKSWENSFQQILARVANGLGCAEAGVSAELYKFLVYDTGAFFKAHRDTEKTGGMFGTLVVVLPSSHRGGELLIRHAGREATVDLAHAEFSEISFAAFYADCEHEVRPVSEGNRVCLVYNLIQSRDGKKSQPLTAPLYDAETSAAAKLLGEAFAAPGAPAKLAWLLEHQYSPAELSFATLKSADAARAKVILAAAERAGCAAHLGIVHIEENGPAQEIYNNHPSRRRGRYRDEDEEEADASSDDFEVIEVSDGSRHIDQWVDEQNRPVEFGKLPLEEGEVLPAGALDDEDPDEQRLMEATGNEGASFERSYHRAALVIWPRERFAGVLLQAGVGAALPHLKERIAACGGAAGTDAQRQPVIAIAGQIVEAWENPPSYFSYRSLAKEPSRAEMLKLLGKLGERALLERFIDGVVTRQYDGSENEALTANVPLLGAAATGELFAQLMHENMRLFHRGCVNLLRRVIRERGEELTAEWGQESRKVAAVIVEALPKLKPAADPDASADWQRIQKAKPVDPAMVADLLESLRALDASALRAEAAAAIAGNVSAFNPGTVIVPALAAVYERKPKAFASDAECGRLWVHAAEFLLARSEFPPAPPADWKQEVKISGCACADCRELQTFVLDAAEQVHRFRVRQDRRSHVENQIRNQHLDMSCATDRKGSPQTLVCTKTRRRYQRQCEQHRADCAAMTTLLDVMSAAPDSLAKLASRLTAAKEHKPEPLKEAYAPKNHPIQSEFP